MDREQMVQIHRKHTRQGIGCFAVVILLLTAAAMLLRQIVPGGVGTVRAYEGPVMPMTAVSGGVGLTAARSVDFDFGSYGEQAGDFVDPNEAVITDTYILTNPGAEAVTAELAYPFVGSFTDEERFLPAVTVEAGPVETELRTAPDPGGTVASAEDWAEFRQAVLERDALSAALEPVTAEAVPVILYEISGLRSEGSGERYLAAEFTMDPERTQVWCCGSIGMVDDEEAGTYARLLHIPSAEEPWVPDRGYLVVVGQDIEGLTLRGYDSYELTDEHRADGVSGELRRQETTFPEAAAMLAQDYVNWPAYGRTQPLSISWQTVYEGAMKRLADPEYQTSAIVYRSLYDLFDAVVSEQSLMYQLFSVTVPPESSVTVSVRYHQQASRDAMGLGTPADGYELATKLGSSLSFTDLGASLTSFEGLEIVEQNFGFDLQSGVTAVSLDPETERYYMVVRTTN